MPAPVGDATALVLLHCPEPPGLRNGMREGNFSLQAPWCACYVLAQVDVADARNKQNLSEKKAIVILTEQKWQRNEGWIKAHKYCGDIKEVKLTWAE